MSCWLYPSSSSSSPTKPFQGRASLQMMHSLGNRSILFKPDPRSSHKATKDMNLGEHPIRIKVHCAISPRSCCKRWYNVLPMSAYSKAFYAVQWVQTRNDAANDFRRKMIHADVEWRGVIANRRKRRGIHWDSNQKVDSKCGQFHVTRQTKGSGVILNQKIIV